MQGAPIRTRQALTGKLWKKEGKMNFTPEVTRFLLLLFAVELITLIASLFLLYLVIKSAIRDGIRESGVIDAMHKRHITTAHIPEVRADR